MTRIQLADIPVIMLAGTSDKDRRKWRNPYYPGKCHEDIAGKEMMEWVTTAITDAGMELDLIMGAKAPKSMTGSFRSLPSEESLPANVWKGLSLLDPDTERALIVAGDIPAASSDGISEFIVKSIEADADVTIPMVPVDLCKKTFPGSRSTAFWASGQHVTMGNLMLVKPKPLLEHKELVEQVIALKKEKRKLAKLAGYGFLANFILAQILRGRRMTFDEIEDLIFAKFGIRAKVIIVHDPGIGFDGDSPKACRILSEYMRRLHG